MDTTIPSPTCNQPAHLRPNERHCDLTEARDLRKVTGRGFLRRRNQVLAILSWKMMINHDWLVVSTNPSENDGVSNSWGYISNIIPNIWKNNPNVPNQQPDDTAANLRLFLQMVQTIPYSDICTSTLRVGKKCPPAGPS